MAIVWTHIFEWYVLRFGFKNGYAKDMCLKEFDLHAQNMFTILGSTSNMRGEGLYDQLMSMSILTLIMNKIFI